MKKFFLFLLWVCACLPGYGQLKGYAIFADSIYRPGYVRFDKSHPFFVEFGRSANDLNSYNYSQVTEFGFDNSRVYVNRGVEVNGKVQRRYLERLLDGDLVVLSDPGRSNTFYLEDEGHLIPLTDQNAESILGPYLEVCPSLQKAISKNTLSNILLRRITLAIRNQQCPPIYSTQVGVSTSVGFMTYNYSGVVNQAFEENYTLYGFLPSVGAYLLMPINTPKLPGLGIRVSASGSQFTLQGLAENGTARYGELQVMLKQIGLGIDIEWKPGEGKFQPFAFIGERSTFLFDPTSQLVSYDVFPLETDLAPEPIIRTSYFENSFQPPTSIHGLSLGGGIYTQVFSRIYIQLGAAYTAQTSFLNPANLISTFSLKLSAGIL